MTLLLLLALAAADPFAAQRAQSGKDLVARAKKAHTRAEWLQLAEDSRIISPDFEKPIRLRDVVDSMNAKGKRRAIFRQALDHLEPIDLAALSSQLPDPEISAAMVRVMTKRGRGDEAAAECRAALGRWAPGDAPILAEACAKCRDGQYFYGGGAALHSVYSQWLLGESRAYHDGMQKGLGNPSGQRWLRLIGVPERDDPRMDGFVAMHEPFGLIVGDAGEPRGQRASALASMLQIPFLSLGPTSEPGDSLRSGIPPGIRTMLPRPGPDALAGALLDIARAQGVRKLALLVPAEAADPRLAHALMRAAGSMTTKVEYVPGRRDRRPDALALRAGGYDAVALLGPGDESADWLPVLRAAKTPLLVLGTDELDPAGFHDLARRAAEGAIYVRTDYAVPDTSVHDAAAWVAGWIVGDAIAHGADSPNTLRRALEKRITEGDSRDAWLGVPPEIARVEVLRVNGGRAERYNP